MRNASSGDEQPDFDAWCRPWPADSGAAGWPESWRGRLIGDLDDRLLAGDSGRLRDHLVMAFLGPLEARAWRRMTGAEIRLNRWLRGRLAAKGAVRDFVRDRFHMEIRPSEIEILPDRNGIPRVGGPWTRETPERVSISLSHAGEISAALAGQQVRGLDLGLDVEPESRVISDRVYRRAFTAGERRLLETAPQTSQSKWRLGFWCAKEAAGKSLGAGLIGHLTEIMVTEADFHSGRLRLTLADGLRGRYPVAGPDIRVRVFEDHGLTAAAAPVP